MRSAVLFLFIAGICSAQTSPANVGATAGILVPGALAGVGYFSNSNGATATATVSVLPAGATTSIPAQVVAADTSGALFVAPDNLPAGDALLTYKIPGQATQWTRATIAPASLSLFGKGASGPLTAQNINPNGTVSLNGLLTPAQPGQVVVLWGTGLGTTPQSGVGITLGGVTQTVLYAGPAPGQPGLSQINFRIAPATPDGCYVPLTIAYGKQSLTSFLSKTSDGLACHHPFGLSVNDMKQLDSGNAIQTGELILSTAIVAPAADRASRQESAQVLLPAFDASGLAALFAPAATASQPCSLLSTAISGVSVSAIFDPAAGVSSTLKNGTSTLTLPWNNSPPDAPLNGLPSPVLAGTKWTWTTSGPSLPPATFDFTLPPALQIAGSTPVTFDRSRDQTVTWNGSVFDSTSTVHLVLRAQYSGAPVLTCSAPAQTGALTLPSSLLAQFTGGSVGSLTLGITPDASSLPHAQVSVPLSGSLIVQWTSSDSRPVDFK